MELNKDNINQLIQKITYQLQHFEVDDEVKEQQIKFKCVCFSMDEWEWPQGVALFAMYQYYRRTGEKEILKYLIDWFDRKIEQGFPKVNINTTCPMLTMTYLYEETQDEKYLPYLREWCREVMEKLPRAGEGGLQHVTSDCRFDGQLWDDTLYMTVLFVARMGVIEKDNYLTEESIRQFLVHIKYLVDRKTGLFFHGWTFEGGHHFSNALWGRGNSWYTAGLVDYLSMISVERGVIEFLLTTLERQVEALAEFQDESGLWHTIINDPETYLETSASSGFAYGILKAVREGLLPEKYESIGMKAVEGVLKNIDEDGIVQGVSGGTPVFQKIEDYVQKVPICPMPYGQSMALLMLEEAIQHIG